VEPHRCFPKSPSEPRSRPLAACHPHEACRWKLPRAHTQANASALSLSFSRGARAVLRVSLVRPLKGPLSPRHGGCQFDHLLPLPVGDSLWTVYGPEWIGKSPLQNGALRVPSVRRQRPNVSGPPRMQTRGPNVTGGLFLLENAGPGCISGERANGIRVWQDRGLGCRSRPKSITFTAPIPDVRNGLSICQC
jgi:hypothetical protein